MVFLEAFIAEIGEEGDEDVAGFLLGAGNVNFLVEGGCSHYLTGKTVRHEGTK